MPRLFKVNADNSREEIPQVQPNRVQTFVRIELGTIKSLLEGYEKRRLDPKDPYRDRMPKDTTVVEFNDSSFSCARKDPDGAPHYGKNVFGCYDDETDTLTIQ